MKDDQNSQSEWHECPSGEISGMLGRIRSRRKAVFIAQLAGGAVFGILLGVAFTQFGIGTGNDRDALQISCTEVREKAADYVNGRLPEAMQERIAVHLKSCDSCGKFLKKQNRSGGQQPAPNSVKGQASRGRLNPNAVANRTTNVDPTRRMLVSRL